MENLNAEQIIKALAFCANNDDCVGVMCPYYATGCENEMPKDALSLIKELTAENKLLNVELGNASSEILRLIDREKELTEENETLTLKVAAYQVKDKLLSNQLDDKCDMCIARERADTVYKMQARLKAKAYTNNYCQEIVLVADIDQIAEEILSDGS